MIERLATLLTQVIYPLLIKWFLQVTLWLAGPMAICFVLDLFFLMRGWIHHRLGRRRVRWRRA